MKKSFVCIFLPSLLNVIGAFSAERYVDINNSSPLSPYSSWTTAATNIQTAVDVAKTGDVIKVAEGEYLISSEILVTNAITIQGIAGPSATIVNAQWLCRGFNLSGPLVAGFTIKNGFSSDDGGGILCSGESTVSNCIIIQCRANGYGGGMFGGSAVHCKISQNTAINGGGGMSWVTAKSCIITENHAGSYGGGMYSGTAYSCVAVSNRSDTTGGGLAANGTTVNGIYNMKIYNCIVYYNAASNGYNDIRNATVANSCSSSLMPGIDNISAAPLFADLAHGNYRLLPDSPCIDSGANAYAQTSNDLDGNPRIVNAIADMGPYEYQWDVENPSMDDDNDGLTNYEETLIGTNPQSSDSDSDGFDDHTEKNHGWNPLSPDNWIASYVQTNESSFHLYSSNIVLNVSLGEILIGISNGTASMRLQLEQSTDINSWTNAGETIEWNLPVSSEKKFFRIQSSK